ncbi:hypothetical protein JZ751_019737 [Albula glossodonta]|uniref:Uncharacterized protein n=1 Tax=Albula glossodonta TaxID=121402 RepID=A0A8T2MT36_9TELE|nr:hypothetical protein JZ751_019737 [Albula glossodonta]
MVLKTQLSQRLMKCLLLWVALSPCHATTLAELAIHIIYIGIGNTPDLNLNSWCSL